MNIDYRVPLRYADDTRTQLLLRRVGANGISALYFLWHYTAAYHVTGILHSMNEETIEMAAKWFGEPGTLVPMLLELGWLGQMNDGTYFIPEWQETNPWAANAENRSAIGRLNGMATHYPELYQQLVEQGANGITAEAYAKLTSEYNKRGIIQSSSIVTSAILANLGNCTTPAPAPAPSPVPEKKDESGVPAAAENSSPKTEKTKTRTAKQRARSTQAVITASAVIENPPISGEYPATAQAVVALWNAKLVPSGFAFATVATPQRIKNFKSCAKYIPEATSMVFWHKVFDKILDSEYMCNAAQEKASWTSVDWILSVSNLAKVLEGKYDNDRKPKTTAKKNTTQSEAVKVNTTPIALPASTVELYGKIQERYEELKNTSVDMPKLSLDEYLHLKFPEAEEEELHRDYNGTMHEDYTGFSDYRGLRDACEIDCACANCTDPEHCQLPAGYDKKRTGRPVVFLKKDMRGRNTLHVGYTVRITCKHNCAKCPAHEVERTEKTPSQSAIPMPACETAYAKPKAAPKADTWEADKYEQDVASIQEKQRHALELLMQMEEASKQKTPTNERTDKEPAPSEEKTVTDTSSMYDEDLWKEDEDEYRLYGDTGINSENEDNKDDEYDDNGILEEYEGKEAGDDDGDIAGE